MSNSEDQKLENSDISQGKQDIKLDIDFYIQSLPRHQTRY